MPSNMWRRRWKPAFVQVLQDANLRASKKSEALSCMERCIKTYNAYARTLTLYTRLAFAGLHLSPLPEHAEIVSQAKILCREYIFQRLKKSGQLSLKMELLTTPSRPSDVSTELQLLGTELERLYPYLYKDISRQLNITMSSDEVVGTTYLAIADAMFKSCGGSSPTGSGGQGGSGGMVTWGKIVAIMSLGGALAQDCVQQGHPQFVNEVVDSFAIITNKYLAAWIAKQGGWAAILRAFRGTREAGTLWALTGLGAVLGFFLTLLIIL